MFWWQYHFRGIIFRNEFSLFSKMVQVFFRQPVKPDTKNPASNFWCSAGADPENSERGGRVLQPPSPHPNPPPQRENFTFQDMQYTAFEGVFVMQSKVTLTFRKTELKSILSNDFQSKIIVLVEEKRGGRGPLGLSPAYVQCHAISKWNRNCSMA